MTSTIPTLREYGRYLESLDRPLDPTTQLVDAMNPATGASSLVELDAARTARSGRRHWLVVAAAVVVVVVIAATVLVDATRDDGIRTRVPAGPNRGVTTIPTLPKGSPPSPGFETLMASGAATSTPPETGELVASAWFGGDLGVYLVYADGRMLWVDDLAGAPGWVERRLTPEGVERVRSELLATGLFDDSSSERDEPCGAVFALLCVRDGDRLLRRGALSGPGTGAAAPGWSPEELLVRERLRTLPSSLPATDWLDQQPTAYLPSQYQVCLAAGSGAGSVAPDPSKVLRALPARASKILRGSEASRPDGLMSRAGCFAVGTRRARVLARELVDTYGAPAAATNPAKSSFEIEARVTGNHRVGPASHPRLQRFAITFMQLLPDGEAALYYRAWA